MDEDFEEELEIGWELYVDVAKHFGQLEQFEQSHADREVSQKEADGDQLARRFQDSFGVVQEVEE